MPFTLLGDKTYYKEVVEQLPPYWNGSMMVEQEPTITYVTFTGMDEPFDGTDAEILPAGVKSSDSRWLFTEEILHIHESFETSAYKSDRIYLKDPAQGRNKPQAYVIAKNEDWDVSEEFSLLEASRDYVITREDRM